MNGHISGSGGHSERVLKAVMIREEVEKELTEIERSLKLVDEEFQSVLKGKYLKSESVYGINLYMDMGISETSFYRNLQKGEMQFAEYYKNGELLLY